MGRTTHLSLCLLPLLVAAALTRSRAGEHPAAEAPVRVRLFDLMPEAVRQAPEAAAAAPAPSTVRYDFDSQRPEAFWSARLDGRDLDWSAAPAVIAAEGGRTGGCLQLGPELPQDLSRASLLFPARGRAKWSVRARVKVEGHPGADDPSSREALRIVEHRTTVVDPTPARLRRQTSERVSRRIDPAGWDYVEVEFVTGSATETVEVQLLHRSGGEASAVTRFDDLELTEQPLDEAAALQHLARRYRPRDGQERETPWRLRVDLMGEVRDAVLVPCDGSIGFPLTLPTQSTKPRLRLHVGALPEAARERGDGSTLSIEFRDDAGVSSLAAVTLDPKNDRDTRGWREVLVDLSPVAGRTGTLSFRVTDVDSEPDPLDALLIATPRIEPLGDGAAPGAFNVLLIGVDTLRADRMSAFGYSRDTTPNLAALANEAVRFTRTRSQAPWTLPSFSSTLTSLYPSVHGAGRGGHDEWEPIDPTTLALAEVLARNGYETAGVVANGLISPRYGLDQGFDAYRSAWAMESVAQDAPRVAAFVATHTATPWLMFWHIMDPHLPYDTARETREKFADPDDAGRFGGSRPNVPFQVLDPRPNRRWFAHEGPPKPPELTESEQRFVADYYDAEIHETDAGIGQVLAALRASGQWERTIIALVADHGEGLLDHGHYHHGYTLFDDQVHIPMLVRVPGRHQGLVIDRPVAAIDLAPTLLGLLGIASPAAFQGVDRLAADAPESDPIFIEYPTYDSSAEKAWVEGRFKYLHDPLFHTEALYDTVADPGELRNIASEHPDVVARGRAALDAFRRQHIDRGRFHLRVRGKAGQRLAVRISTDDLFDANFVAYPAVDERHFEMDLGRTKRALDTTLSDGRQELVVGCRGSVLSVDATLDGAPLAGLELREGRAPLRLPAAIPRDEIEQRVGEDSVWPRERRALLWLEAGAGDVLPVVNTPEEIERLKALGYSR